MDDDHFVDFDGAVASIGLKSRDFGDTLGLAKKQFRATALAWWETNFPGDYGRQGNDMPASLARIELKQFMARYAPIIQDALSVEMDRLREELAAVRERIRRIDVATENAEPAQQTNNKK